MADYKAIYISRFREHSEQFSSSFSPQEHRKQLLTAALVYLIFWNINNLRLKQATVTSFHFLFQLYSRSRSHRAVKHVWSVEKLTRIKINYVKIKLWLMWLTLKFLNSKIKNEDDGHLCFFFRWFEPSFGNTHRIGNLTADGLLDRGTSELFLGNWLKTTEHCVTMVSR